MSPGDDGERQRHAHDDGGARADDAVDIDDAADLLDIGAHHVHADAAARDGGDCRGRGEAGVEDELELLLVGQRGRFGSIEQPGGDRPVDHAGAIDAAPRRRRSR